MKKFISDIYTTIFEGMMVTFSVLMVVGWFLFLLLVFTVSLMAIFGPHDYHWLRLVGLVGLFYFVGRFVDK